jgi:hypothetical protein
MSDTESKSDPKTTTDHEPMRAWVEERGGRPATVRGTKSGTTRPVC